MKRKFYGEEYAAIERKKAGDPRIQKLGGLYEVLRQCWTKETAYPSCQAEWVESDPTYYQKTRQLPEKEGFIQ